ncbi:hypothetical protein Scep_004328 [Stephania cephalantha]|uniref:Uncharacterized protein n=1 Tax=Stephania cephalantha TaxID=152367 RepID=A0AAP0KV43_9MAGN
MPMGDSGRYKKRHLYVGHTTRPKDRRDPSVRKRPKDLVTHPSPPRFEPAPSRITAWAHRAVYQPGPSNGPLARRPAKAEARPRRCILAETGPFPLPQLEPEPQGHKYSCSSSCVPESERHLYLGHTPAPWTDPRTPGLFEPLPKDLVNSPLTSHDSNPRCRGYDVGSWSRVPSWADQRRIMVVDRLITAGAFAIILGSSMMSKERLVEGAETQKFTNDDSTYSPLLSVLEINIGVLVKQKLDDGSVALAGGEVQSGPLVVVLDIGRGDDQSWFALVLVGVVLTVNFCRIFVVYAIQLRLARRLDRQLFQLCC